MFQLTIGDLHLRQSVCHLFIWPTVTVNHTNHAACEKYLNLAASGYEAKAAFS
jgi:hypothetical protein